MISERESNLVSCLVSVLTTNTCVYIKPAEVQHFGWFYFKNHPVGEMRLNIEFYLKSNGNTTI